MGKQNEKVTNVGQQHFVTLVSSVQGPSGSIVPDRFGSISSPVATSLITPELGSLSTPQPVKQHTGESQ